MTQDHDSGSKFVTPVPGTMLTEPCWQQAALPLGNRFIMICSELPSYKKRSGPVLMAYSGARRPMPPRQCDEHADAYAAS